MLTNLIELCFHGHLLVTGGTGKVVDTPGLEMIGESRDQGGLNELRKCWVSLGDM